MEGASKSHYTVREMITIEVRHHIMRKQSSGERMLTSEADQPFVAILGVKLDRDRLGINTAWVLMQTERHRTIP